ncbi:hypothetical protein NMG60_11006518 [Bertholletia excelsa]
MTVKGGTSQACAACKHRRQKCRSDCPLAPYFPANNTKMFMNAHRLFGISNIMKILKQLDNKEQRDEAMKSILFESELRERFPVGGCCEYIAFLHCQWAQAIEELQCVRAQLAICKEGANQTLDQQNFNSADLQLGMMLQNHLIVSDANDANGDNGYVGQLNEDTRSIWVQNPNHDVVYENDPVGVQQQISYAPTFSVQQNQTLSFQQQQNQTFSLQQDQTELDYNDIQFDCVADDRQSYVESKEVCESR